MRVVSLVPSATETLLAWGIGPVGVTRFCCQPALNAVGGTKDPDIAAVVDLHPDLVVMCEEENRVEDHEALRAAGLDTHVLRIDEVADVQPALSGLGEAIGVDAAAMEIPEFSPVGSVRAFVPVWRRPWMSLAAYTYGSSLLATLGVVNVFGDAETRYPEVSLQQVAEREPEVVIAPSEPYPFGERHRSELESLAPVVFMDGQDLFWWGVRTPAALRRLSEALGSVPGL